MAVNFPQGMPDINIAKGLGIQPAAYDFSFKVKQLVGTN